MSRGQRLPECGERRLECGQIIALLPLCPPCMRRVGGHVGEAFAQLFTQLFGEEKGCGRICEHGLQPAQLIRSRAMGNGEICCEDGSACLVEGEYRVRQRCKTLLTQVIYEVEPLHLSEAAQDVCARESGARINLVAEAAEPEVWIGVNLMKERAVCHSSSAPPRHHLSCAAPNTARHRLQYRSTGERCGSTGAGSDRPQSLRRRKSSPLLP